jgi:hypothetical protein
MDYQARTVFPAIDSDAGSIIDVPNPTGTPERRLLLAILERAILDYVGNDSVEVVEAETWLFGGDDDDSDNDLFSFPGICRELDLDPITVAARIKGMPRRGHHRVAPWYFTKSA